MTREEAKRVIHYHRAVQLHRSTVATRVVCQHMGKNKAVAAGQVWAWRTAAAEWGPDFWRGPPVPVYWIHDHPHPQRPL